MNAMCKDSAFWVGHGGNLHGWIHRDGGVGTCEGCSWENNGGDG